VVLEAVVTVPTASPAPVIAVVAAACVSPTTFGTNTGGGPVETTRLTADPEATEVPATGVSLITSPGGTVVLAAVVTVPTVSPAPVIAVVAAACVSPTTFGTETVDDLGHTFTRFATLMLPIPVAKSQPAVVPKAS
jgi:hypothetical protein